LPSVKVEKQKTNNKYHFHSRENPGLINIKNKILNIINSERDFVRS